MRWRFSSLACLISASFVLLACGCAAIPDRAIEPQFHNPFPQLHRVAVLPFYNQSAEPTLDGDQVAQAYYNELQLIPGFEVMPVGVARQLLAASGIRPRTGADFQRLARLMGVDAVLVGSVTDYSPYYPPRIGIAVDWYAANPGFHPIPPGYGLPWGRAEEEYIPDALVQEAEFALAREQLKTQTPEAPADSPLVPQGEGISNASHAVRAAQSPAQGELPPGQQLVAGVASGGAAAGLPADWPDPRGFVPPPPCFDRPALRPQHEPIITHTRIYHGQDGKFTEKLASYYYFRDDARFGGWASYLQRPDDFLRFCCYLHVTETLAARGGAGRARVVWRWPIGRYDQ
jgi:hypothetical protein